MSMRPVYVKFEERHHRILRQRARDEGCSISDVIRRAAIGFFHLPTDSDEIADARNLPATAPAVIGQSSADAELVEAETVG